MQIFLLENYGHIIVMKFQCLSNFCQEVICCHTPTVKLLSGVAWVIGARGGRQFCRPQKS